MSLREVYILTKRVYEKSISNRKDYMQSLYEKSISNQKLYTKSLYEKSISKRKSIGKVYI